MSITQKTLENSILSTDFESQALVTTILNDYKETVPPKISISDLLQNTTSFDEMKSSLNCSRTSFIDKEETQQDSVSAPTTVEIYLKNSQKKQPVNLNLQSHQN